jgi:hypothetical protein
MTTVKNLHALINNFVSFCNLEIKQGADEIALRLLLPSVSFHQLMNDFDSTKVDSPKWFLNSESVFVCSYKYTNVKLIIQEEKTFRIELIPGNQEMVEVDFGGYIVDGGLDVPKEKRKPVTTY